MIERDHQHVMTPTNVFDREDGRRVIHMRCNSQPATPQNPTPCNLEEERVYHGERLERLRYRINLVWFAYFDLVRSLPNDVRECEHCHGDDWIIPCKNCHGLGIESPNGGPITAPDLHVARS